VVDTLPALAINAAEVIAAIEAQARRTVTPEQVRREVAQLDSREWAPYIESLRDAEWADKD
jgi:hypothetical protein